MDPVKKSEARPLPSMPQLEDPALDPNFEFYQDVILPAGGISNTNLKKNQKLGSGQFGVVYSGILKKDTVQIECAIKELLAGQTEDEIRKFKQEAKLMMEAHSPNVVSCFGVTVDEPVCIIQELMPLGDLHTYLRTQGPRRATITVGERYYLSYQIANGMNHLAQHGIVHRDLAARNCMLGHPTPRTFGIPVVKITDFGLSRNVQEDSEYYTMNTDGKVPLAWMAPETIKELKFSEASDVWSFGVTMWEIFSDAATKPYANVAKNPYAILQYITSGQRLHQPTGCPSEAYDTMLTAWDANKSARPSFFDLSCTIGYCFIPHCVTPVTVMVKGRFSLIVMKDDIPSGGDYYDNILHEGEDYYEYSELEDIARRTGATPVPSMAASAALEVNASTHTSPIAQAADMGVSTPAIKPKPANGNTRLSMPHNVDADSKIPISDELTGKSNRKGFFKGRTKKFWIIFWSTLAAILVIIVGAGAGIAIAMGGSSTDLCEGVSCDAGFTCNSSNGVCEENNGPIPGESPTPTLTPSITPSPSFTPTASLSFGASPTVTPTISISPSVTPSNLPTPSISGSPAISPTPSQSTPPTPTVAPSPLATVTPTNSPPVVVITVSPAVTPAATVSPGPSVAVSPLPTTSPAADSPLPTTTPTAVTTPDPVPTTSSTTSTSAEDTFTILPTEEPPTTITTSTSSTAEEDDTTTSSTETSTPELPTEVAPPVEPEVVPEVLPEAQAEAEAQANTAEDTTVGQNSVQGRAGEAQVPDIFGRIRRWLP